MTAFIGNIRQPDPTYWQDRPVLVTGGASFIGSHLVDALVNLGAKVVVADDLTSGRISNIESHIASNRIQFHQVDLRVADTAERLSRGIDTIFHLAAAHGGRGYLDLHQADCAGNLVLDGLVFQAAIRARVRKVVFGSSGCVYPLDLQKKPQEQLLLTEEMVGPPYEADGMYGWAKLMAEMTLQALYKEKGLAAVSCRYFTVYGPRGTENHAMLAMMARALIKQDPFIVWGDGTQVRNWTYVSDIVDGTILSAEKIDDARAVNIGTSERITVTKAVQTILELSEHKAKIEYQPWMPTGPLNRVASFENTQELLHWYPQVPFAEGVRRTFEWYRQVKQKQEIEQKLDHLLFERGLSAQSLR